MQGDSEIKWYQVPIVWLGIAIFITVLLACAHLIIVSQSLKDSEANGQVRQTTEGSYFKGVLLKKE